MWTPTRRGGGRLTSDPALMGREDRTPGHDFYWAWQDGFSGFPCTEEIFVSKWSKCSTKCDIPIVYGINRRERKVLTRV
ncbi:MAG: hypothetical protein A4E62_02105 [Syntrophorhabdus sp. PtaU1.Bin002]|nr:MAG: hypothetical protein A4E62_02105 [Syntrophorhabdus sp. PtaU1.Bin002]